MNCCQICEDIRALFSTNDDVTFETIHEIKKLVNFENIECTNCGIGY